VPSPDARLHAYPYRLARMRSSLTKQHQSRVVLRGSKADGLPPCNARSHGEREAADTMKTGSSTKLGHHHDRRCAGRAGVASAQRRFGAESPPCWSCGTVRLLLHVLQMTQSLAGTMRDDPLNRVRAPHCTCWSVGRSVGCLPMPETMNSGNPTAVWQCVAMHSFSLQLYEDRCIALQSPDGMSCDPVT
jgi:hypothetical protein